MRVFLQRAWNIGIIAATLGAGASTFLPKIFRNWQNSEYINRSNKTQENNKFVVEDDNDAQFQALEKEIEQFAEKCKSEVWKTALEDLKDIFVTLLEPDNKEGNNTEGYVKNEEEKDRDTYLKEKKEEIEKYLEDKQNEKELFEKLYKKLEDFSKPLRGKNEKYFKYINQLGGHFPSFPIEEELSPVVHRESSNTTWKASNDDSGMNICYEELVSEY